MGRQEGGPARVRRPGLDAAFHVFIAPLLVLGIVHSEQSTDRPKGFD